MDIEYVLSWAVIAGIVYLFFKFAAKASNASSEQHSQVRKSALQKANRIITKNRKKLGLQRLKSIHHDPYGKVVLQHWMEKEIPYFIDHHILPVLTDAERVHFSLGGRKELVEMIERVASEVKNEKNEFKSSMSGHDFELFCAEKLKKEGWIVEVTRNGPDQGIDLIISKRKRRIGVQCKKYSRPVGNKAVQEVKTGLLHYGLDEGVVIGCGGFTHAAIQLAQSNRIAMKHYLETESI